MLTTLSETLTFRVRNVLEAIEPANKSAEVWLAERQVPSDISYFVSLAVDELVTNCIKYGYDDSAEHFVEVTLAIVGHTVTMLVLDDGHAFDPLAVPAPDISRPVEDRPIGGLGIHLLRELADNISYERRDGMNRLTLVKKLP